MLFKKMNLFSSALFVFLTSLWWISLTNAFNIDTQDLRVLTGPTNSHFGYSLRFDTKAFGEGHINLLVGAPKNKKKANNGIPIGSLLSCPDVLDRGNCDEITSDNRFPGFVDDPMSFKDEGYGSTFSVSENGNKIVCAPQWKDTKYVKDYNYIFMPGRCEVFFQHEGKTVAINILPFYNRLYMRKQQYFYGLADFGISADIHKNSVFAVGSPGLTIFEGGVTILDFKSLKYTITHTVGEYRNTLNTTAYGYLGYDVKFGQFCKSPVICLAAGAPQLNSIGVVRLYTWYNRENLVNFQTIQGEKTWSYFGSVLCAADVDGDKMDELFVGAPYYTESKKEPDIGKVYVYKRKSMSKFFHLDQMLDGERAKYSRFGSAIQAIGDVNLDGYTDIAVGAPGEGNGCIYIYFGNEDGLGNRYTQRICAQDIPSINANLRSFGSAISGPSNVPGKSYPIFAVGAFQSDTVIVFRSRSVLQVTPFINVNPNPVDINVKCSYSEYDGPCTTIQLCLSQLVIEGPSVQRTKRELYYKITLKIKTQSNFGRQKRAAILDGPNYVDYVEQSVMVNGSNKCLEPGYLVIIGKRQLEKDRFTPIQVEMTYQLDADKTTSDTPILDPSTPNNIYQMITFANDCGSDNICHVDLQVHGRLVYSSDKENRHIIFGYTKEVIALITISNTEEPCYWTEIRIKLNQPLDLSRFTSDKLKQCQTITDSSNSRGTTVVCNYYQSLVLDDPLSLVLTFETDNLSEDEKKLTLTAEARSTDERHNPELTPDNNRIRLMADVFIVAEVHILGVATPLELTIKKAKRISSSKLENVKEIGLQKVDNEIELNHKVLMKNKGPNFVPKTKVKLDVPVFIPDGTRLVTGIAVKLITGYVVTDCSQPLQGSKYFSLKSTTTPMPPSKSTTKEERLTTSGELVFTTFSDKLTRRKRDIDTKEEGNSSTIFILTCDATPEYCLTFVCDFPKVIQSGGHAELNVTLRLDKDNIPIPKDYTTFKLELRTVLEQPQHKLFKPWNETDLQQTLAITHTVFHLYESGGEINLWIIIGSVVAGVLVLIVVVIVIWKLGFFKRKRHCQVQKWRTESMKSRKSESMKSRSGKQEK